MLIDKLKHIKNSNQFILSWKVLLPLDFRYFRDSNLLLLSVGWCINLSVD